MRALARFAKKREILAEVIMGAGGASRGNRRHRSMFKVGTVMLVVAIMTTHTARVHSPAFWTGRLASGPQQAAVGK